MGPMYIETHCIRIYGQDIVIEFGNEKYILLTMKRGKEETSVGIEVPNHEIIKTLVDKDN